MQRLSNYGTAFYDGIEELREIIARLADRQSSHEVEKALLHTLKGSSAVSGMHSIPRIVHQIETKLEDSNGRLDRHDLDLLQSR